MPGMCPLPSCGPWYQACGFRSMAHAHQEPSPDTVAEPVASFLWSVLPVPSPCALAWPVSPNHGAHAPRSTVQIPAYRSWPVAPGPQCIYAPGYLTGPCRFWPTEHEHTASLPTALTLTPSPCPCCVCSQCLHMNPGLCVLAHGSQTVVYAHSAHLHRSRSMGPGLHLPVHSVHMLTAADLALSSGCGDESLEHGQGKALGRGESQISHCSPQPERAALA